MTIAIDFDDTIMDNQAVAPGYRMGPPEPGAVAAINKLHEEGHTIVIFTARNVQEPRVKKTIADWLDYFRIPYHLITNVKQPEFDVYIDNRALHYQSWPQAWADLHRAEAHWKNWSGDVPAHGGLISDITKPLLDNRAEL